MNEIATTSKGKASTKFVEKILSVTLDGTRSLSIEKVTIEVRVFKHIDPKTRKAIFIESQEEVNRVVEHLTYPLTETTPSELELLRREGVSGFIYKWENRYFWSEIPDDLSLLGSEKLGKHICTNLGNECYYFAPVNDVKNMCPKVRSQHPRIECYPWIVTGYQTFNSKYNAFVVLECEHFKRQNAIPQQNKREKLI